MRHTSLIQNQRLAGSTPAPDTNVDAVCPNCGEHEQLARVKGCVRCLRCGHKGDCDGFGF